MYRLLLWSCVLALGSSPLVGFAAEQTGTVRSGPTPIQFSTVTLYSAGQSQGGAPAFLGSAQTGADGGFTISFSLPESPSTVLYLIADGGLPAQEHGGRSRFAPPIRLAAVLGLNPAPDGVTINERTTVAAAYALAQFLSGSEAAGTSPGLPNAAATAANLADLGTGAVGAVLANPPNGLKTSTMREFNSLANLLASCVNATTPPPCNRLFELTRVPGGEMPRNTLDAIENLAHNPWMHSPRLFLQTLLHPQYSPALLLPPGDWALAILYEGNGHEFDGPGNMAVDAKGSIWITNNYEYNENPFACTAGSRALLKLTPTGQNAPGAPYRGGGLYGAGFGIALDPSNQLWVGNFGFQGVDQGVNCDPNPPATSMSKFDAAGDALSPPRGYQRYVDQPQGTASDQAGNIWVANCGSNSVTEYPQGNPAEAINYRNLQIIRPFGLAVDGAGNVWVASNGTNSVTGLSPDGTLLPGTPVQVGLYPLGVAVDTLGNVWVSNSGMVELPCGNDSGGVHPPSQRPAITEVTRQGSSASARSFTGGGLTAPWGIAIDGNDNVWVANFAGRRVSQFCGARPEHCPNGLRTGDPISPIGGFSSDALMRNTGVVIDPSGNVWLANNWRTIAIQTNPGGDGMVEFVGIAAPVKTPVIGPPQRP